MVDHFMIKRFAICLLMLPCLFPGLVSAEVSTFRAGASAIDMSPRQLPAIRKPEIETEVDWTIRDPDELPIFIGGRCDNLFGLEGKMDEIVLFDRALSAPQVEQHFLVSEQRGSACSGVPARLAASGTPTVASRNSCA